MWPEMDHSGLKWPKESKTRVIQSGPKVFKVAQIAEVAQSCPKWPKVTQSGPKWTKVDQSGLIEISLFFDWLNKRVAFRKICFPYFARDKWSDHDFENVLKSDSWLGSEKSQILRQWLEIGAFRGSKTASAFYNLLCLILQEMNDSIMITKIVLKSVLWRGS